MIEYAIDGHRFQVGADTKHRLRCKKDGKRCRADELVFPTKVIALTTTPFDKFRVTGTPWYKSGSERTETTERYVYLGLRDRTGRASPTAAIFRAIEGLFEVSRSKRERRLRVAEVFNFLGYKPQITVRYDFTTFGLEVAKRLAEGEPPPRVNTPMRFQRSLSHLKKRNPSVLRTMRSACARILRRARGDRSFLLRADFEGRSRDEELFRRVQILSKLELVRMRTVEVKRAKDGVVLDLKSASSGELGLVTHFLGLASVIEDGSLIFIDEPEISLHPEWQNRYVDLLQRTFTRFRGCHFVLATHCLFCHAFFGAWLRLDQL
jgi:hypothetical protein